MGELGYQLLLHFFLVMPKQGGKGSLSQQIYVPRQHHNSWQAALQAGGQVWATVNFHLNLV